MSAGPAGPPARLVLVGVRGFGEVYAAKIARLAEQGLVELVATVDPGVSVDPPVAHGAPLHADLPGALDAVGPVDVVIIAAPLGEHFVLAETALRAGADVMLEKPPVASLDDFTRLLAVERETGRRVQVGFQSLGSQALPLFAADAFGIGPLTRVGAVGAWSRPLAYWNRSAWAGRRSLHGRAVVDGVVTNPLAHAVVTALALVGARELDEVTSVETDLYRANAIDSDDTSVVRIRTRDGGKVTCALTLCAAEQRDPVLHLTGTRGRATFGYTTDEVEVEGGGPARTVDREDLLENLIASRRDGRALLVPLVSTGAFMRVLAAVSDAEEPVRIDPRAIRWEGEGQDRRPVVDDVEHWLERAASTGQTFRELGVPWAHAAVTASWSGRAWPGWRWRSTSTAPAPSPRPRPAPCCTPCARCAGVVVSARHPADHDWHTGVGMAVPDVDGTNFWGGGTYVHGEGYQLLDDHGVVQRRAARAGAGRLPPAAELGAAGTVPSSWRSAAVVDWVAVDARTWRLGFGSRPARRAGCDPALTGQQGTSRRRVRRILLALPGLRAPWRCSPPRRGGRTRCRAASAPGWPGRRTSWPGPGSAGRRRSWSSRPTRPPPRTRGSCACATTRGWAPPWRGTDPWCWSLAASCGAGSTWRSRPAG